MVLLIILSGVAVVGLTTIVIVGVSSRKDGIKPSIPLKPTYKSKSSDSCGEVKDVIINGFFHNNNNSYSSGKTLRLTKKR